MTRKTDPSLTRPGEERLRGLLIRALAGDAGAYHAFLADLTGHLRGFLRKRLYYLQDDIEDIVQEILVAVHNARHTYRPEEPLTAWIHAIARYKLADHLRARSRREALHDPLDDESELFAESDVEPANAKRDLDKLLGHLPDKQRLPIVHVKLEGLSVAETARLTGLSESAIKIGVHRGLKALALKIQGAAV
jgi:RNA polymerase sigma-70 factor (ECF subfamily)